jgi:hypothetical protein
MDATRLASAMEALSTFGTGHATALAEDLWSASARKGTRPVCEGPSLPQHHGLVAKMLVEEPGPVGEYFSGFRRIGIQDEVDVRHAFKDVQFSLYIGSA